MQPYGAFGSPPASSYPHMPQYGSPPNATAPYLTLGSQQQGAPYQASQMPPRYGDYPPGHFR